MRICVLPGITLISCWLLFSAFSPGEKYLSAPGPEEAPACSSSSAVTFGPIYVATADLNLYQYQTTSSPVILQVPKGAAVKVVDSRNGSWWQIRYENRTGYALSKSLRYSNRNDDLNHDPIVNVSSLYESRPLLEVPHRLELFEHPSSSSAILTRLPGGAEVRIIDSSNTNWLFVHYKGHSGYIQQQQLSAANQSAPATATATVTTSNTGDFVLTQPTSLRAAPDSKARVLLRFSVGDSVSVLEDSGTWWWKVRFKDQEGWVKRRLLEKK